MKISKIGAVLCIAFFLVQSIYAQLQSEQITLENLWKTYDFYPESVDGIQSMTDGVHYTSLEKRGREIVQYKYDTGEKINVIFKVSDYDELKYITDYQFNNLENKILIETNKKLIYRRSYKADYFIYNLADKSLKALSSNGKQQLASMSPDGSKVAYVRDNNLYIVDLNDYSEKQITADGAYNKIINGAPDWVYEEEFEFARAYVWSTDGKKLAYMKFDETEVPVFYMNEFVEDGHSKASNSYPQNSSFKYPKAGEQNSKVTLHCYHTDTEKTITIDRGNKEYVPRLKWTNDANKLCFYTLNRRQNELELFFADAHSGQSTLVYTDLSKQYINEQYFDDFYFTDEDNNFIIISERDGYAQAYYFNLKEKQAQLITKGNFDLIKLYGYHAESKMLYYQAAERSPLQREVYAIRIDGKKKKCLSADIAGTYNANFSTSFEYYINYFSNTKTPTQVTLHNSKGVQLRQLEDNANLKHLVKRYGGSRKTFFKFTTTEGVELNGWMIKPETFDSTQKYPCLMTQYSGPNSQKVLNEWEFNWYDMMAQKGYVVVCVDGRGTGGRGVDFRNITYLQLGKYELADQIETAKYLGNLNYIDKDRIGIWGWSYGGFMVANCMLQGADYFKLGIAVAPISNWKYYDNIYTERFMHKPTENPSGYTMNSPISHASKLKGKLLLIHGTSDDNVHVQNTYKLAEALADANKQFDMQIYTNKNHSIYGGNTRMHLYTLMTNYIIENL